MYVQKHLSGWGALRFTWPVLLVVGVWSTLLVASHNLLGLEGVRLLGLPTTLIGTAVSFYLGFKGNAAYERLWEARKIWGGIVNTSRTWGVYARTLVSDAHVDGTPPSRPLVDDHRVLIYRHIGWLQALRTQLRRAKPWEHREAWNDRFRELRGTRDQSPARLAGRLAPFVSEAEHRAVMAQKNQSTQLLRLQAEHLRDLWAEGRIDSFRHMEMVGLLQEMYTLQGKCERIKNFPLPRQYATTSHWFVKLFVLLVPGGLLGTVYSMDVPELYSWAVIPASMIVGWVFYAWDVVVSYSENPFEGLSNDIPMDALTRTIENDLREMLGETDLPLPKVPHQDIALM